MTDMLFVFLLLTDPGVIRREFFSLPPSTTSQPRPWRRLDSPSPIKR
jgi:hypothetical protein